MADLRAERLALNESAFRIMNERMSEWAERHEDEQPEAYYCECSEASCRERVSLTRAEYEAVREDSRRFVVATGHADVTVERVVDQTSRFDVVQKHEDVRPLVERTDPRQ